MCAFGLRGNLYQNGWRLLLPPEVGRVKHPLGHPEIREREYCAARCCYLRGHMKGSRPPRHIVPYPVNKTD